MARPRKPKTDEVKVEKKYPLEDFVPIHRRTYEKFTNFTNKRRITPAIRCGLPMPIILMLFALIDKAKKERPMNAYQQFEFRRIDNDTRWEITHVQNAPNPFKEIYYTSAKRRLFLEGYVKVIDDGNETVMSFYGENLNVDKHPYDLDALVEEKGGDIADCTKKDREGERSA